MINYTITDYNPLIGTDGMAIIHGLHVAKVSSWTQYNGKNALPNAGLNEVLEQKEFQRIGDEPWWSREEPSNNNVLNVRFRGLEGGNPLWHSYPGLSANGTEISYNDLLNRLAISEREISRLLVGSRYLRQLKTGPLELILGRNHGYKTAGSDGSAGCFS